MSDYSIIPPTGAKGLGWPSGLNLTQGLEGNFSSAGWTDGNEGFVQQTFLGASVADFNIRVGFGDTSSNLDARLINDETNISDGTPVGQGDDVYHNGQHDEFKPPVVGAPVFFKFGKNFADISQAWTRTYNETYGLSLPNQQSFSTEEVDKPLSELPFPSAIKISETDDKITFENRSILSDPNYAYRGLDHFVFGGILTNYSKQEGDVESYNVSVSDPREILSNTELILGNYAGTTFNNKNLLNVYGFLEYDRSENLESSMESASLSKNVLTRSSNDVELIGNGLNTDMYTFLSPTGFTLGEDNSWASEFPVTGQGMSRKSEQGIPWYRVYQGLTALFNYNGSMPQEYIDAGFGGFIDFRGYKYVVDLGGLPLDKIPLMYFLNYDKIDLLSLIKEVTEAISHDYFVSLLPVLNSPKTSWLHDYNNFQIQNGTFSNVVTGIIRIDVVDKTEQPDYGAITRYIQNLEQQGFEVSSKNNGYQVSNITTDKFVVGAQTQDMYFFSTNKDRAYREAIKNKNGKSNDGLKLFEDQWSHETMLKQQVIPFYGFLGEEAVTIPRGFGSYQQIMLDSRGVEANGIADYYIATEMELRAAAISYEAWCDFLRRYNDRYCESSQSSEFEIDDRTKAEKNKWLKDFAQDWDGRPDDFFNNDKSKAAVAVPRCVFTTSRESFDKNGNPNSPCAPPYGYPLYFGRADRIGVTGGDVDFISNYTRISKQQAELKKDLKEKRGEFFEFLEKKDPTKENIERHYRSLRLEKHKKLGTNQDQLRVELEKLREREEIAVNQVKEYEAIGVKLRDADNYIKKNSKDYVIAKRNSERALINSKIIYEFVKGVAQNLGRKFLVKVPKKTNIGYSEDVYGDKDENYVNNGPFGFRPLEISGQTIPSEYDEEETFHHFLDSGNTQSVWREGALRTNYNPISKKWTHNYQPSSFGYMPYNILDGNHHLSSMLFPTERSNFFKDGKIPCYVRFNNSEHLDFSSFSKDSFTQQIVTAGGVIPDIVDITENSFRKLNLVDPDALKFKRDFKDPRVAFVLASVDEKLYMPPKTSKKEVKVYGETIHFIPYALQEDDQGRISVPFLSYGPGLRPYVSDNPQISFTSDELGGFDGREQEVVCFDRRRSEVTKSNEIITDSELLDSDNVYVLVTLTDAPLPTTNKMYVDSLKNYDIKKEAYLLGRDVVNGVFSTPPSETDPLNRGTYTRSDIINKLNPVLQTLQKQGEKPKYTLGNPELQLDIAYPSPVIPDIFCVPFMSNERCYGPWLSNGDIGDGTSRYSNIGGKVEFIKDETLNPWDYFGYYEMNQAGIMKAQFSNSLLLIDENGSFTFNGDPGGITMAAALISGGPVVTELSVTVGEGSINTTVGMKTYASAFGQLKRQKEDQLANIARDRQKMSQEIDKMKRLRLLSGQRSIQGSAVSLGREATNRREKTIFSPLVKQETAYDRLVITNDYTEQEVPTTSGTKVNKKDFFVNASLQHKDYAEEAAGLAETKRELDINFKKTSLENINQIFDGFDEDVYNPFMATKEYKNTRSRNRRMG